MSDTAEERAGARPGAPASGAAEDWPSLPYDAWKDTYETLHMWTQVVGKIRLELTPLVNHWWNVTLYVTPRGLTTSSMPYAGGAEACEIAFDFIDHKLTVQTSRGQTRVMGLFPRSVADFYQELMSMLRSVGVHVRINTTPQEVPNPIACDIDTTHDSYDEAYANHFWRILLLTDNVMKEFRTPFLGKASPAHFFWGSFDLAQTRFSGRRAPERPGADLLTREAYSHECSSVGFWPGSSKLLAPAFYAYFAPAPDGLAAARVRPDAAYYDSDMGEFILRYDDVRATPAPRQVLLDFMQSTYEAGANLAGWDRAALERPSGQ